MEESCERFTSLNPAGLRAVTGCPGALHFPAAGGTVACRRPHVQALQAYSLGQQPAQR